MGALKPTALQVGRRLRTGRPLGARQARLWIGRRSDPPPALPQRRPQAQLGAAPRRGDPGPHGPQRGPPLLRPQDQPRTDA